jgi:hypothetical protein
MSLFERLDDKPILWIHHKIPLQIIKHDSVSRMVVLQNRITPGLIKKLKEKSQLASQNQIFHAEGMLKLKGCQKSGNFDNSYLRKLAPNYSKGFAIKDPV